MKRITLEYPSPLALSERKKELQSELYTKLFLSQPNNKIIIAPLYLITRGATYEQEATEVLPFDSTVNEIGKRAKASLMLFEQPKKPLPPMKQSDWPAYRASKARSIKAFKSEYVYISIRTINTTIQLEAWANGSEQIFVGAYISPACDSKAFGLLLLQIYQCCLQLNQAGLFATNL